MQFVDRIKQVKIALVVIAIIIAFVSLLVSHFLVRDLSVEERNKMEVWSEAMRTFSSADYSYSLTPLSPLSPFFLMLVFVKTMMILSFL